MNALDLVITMHEAAQMYNSTLLAAKEADIRQKNQTEKQGEQTTAIPFKRHATLEDFIDSFMKQLSEGSHGDIVLMNNEKTVVIRREKGVYKQPESFINKIDAKKK